MSTTAREIWNSLDPTLQLVLAGGIGAGCNDKGLSCKALSLRDDCFYNTTDDSMDLEINIINSGRIAFWINLSLSEEKHTEIKKKLGKLYPELKLVQGYNQLLQSPELKVLSKLGLVQANNEQPFHLPMFLVDTFSALPWNEILANCQSTLDILFTKREGTSLKELLKEHPCNMNLESNLDLWF